MSQQDHHGEKELAAFIRAGAERRPEQAYGHDYRGKKAILVHLNDDHRWSREQIAGWLDGLK